jgi:fucose 4-O-acetylase-like acetyltransferase
MNSRSFLSSPERLPWVDATKGLAIILVVFGHVLGGVMARGWVQQGGPALVTYNFIYMFHMPLFFLIAGAFAIDGIRSDPRNALLSRLGTILWPYAVWGTIDIILDPFVDQFRGSPHNDPSFLVGFKHLLLGEASWFLWAFFIAHCVLIVTKIIPVLVVFLFSLALWLLLSNWDLGTFGAVIRFLPFMALGAAIGRENLVAFFRSRWSSPILGIALLGALFGLAALGRDSTMLNSPLVLFTCGVVGSSALTMLAKWYEPLRIESLLAACGAASLVVFLLHPYFQGASRVLVFQIFGTVAWAQLGICTFIAVVGPTFIWWLSERCSCRWLFRVSPRHRKKQASSLTKPSATIKTKLPI